MPRETLRLLDGDVERLLLAGGAAAATDDGLAARRDALQGFAAKVPVLGKVAEQVGKVVGAKPRVATTELLNLAATNAQLRGAQAAPGRAAGELRAVPAVPAIDTPLAYHQVDAVIRALTDSGGERVDVITDAVERGLVRDLRLVKPWLNALSETAIADEVATLALPLLGDVVVAPLMAAFKLDGGAVDARRLECLAVIQGEAARPLLLRALEQGSPRVRAAAIESLARIDPAGTEPLARALFATDKSADVRAAAVTACAATPNDATLGVLLEALDDAADVRRVASVALRTFAHPDTTARLLALLSPEVLDIKPYVPPKVKKGTKLTPAQQKAAEKEQQAAMKKVHDRVAHATAVMDLLGSRNDDAAIARLAEVWKAHAMTDLREAAGRALLSPDEPRPAALEAIAACVGDEQGDVRGVALEGLLDKARSQSYAWLSPLFAPAELAKKHPRALEVVSHLSDLSSCANDAARDVGEKFDARWHDMLFGLVGHANDSLSTNAVELLALWKDARVFDAAVKLLEEKNGWDRALSALGALGDKRATPVVVALLNGKRGATYWYNCYDTLRELDDPSAVPALRAWTEGKLKKTDQYRLNTAKSLIEWLERDRTVA